MSGVGLSRLRSAMWEFLRHDGDAGRRHCIHTALTSSNPAWLERTFRLVTSELPAPLPDQFRRDALFYRPEPRELEGPIFVGHSEDGVAVNLPLDCFGPLGDVIVTGVKGAGKSTLLKHLALQLAEHVDVCAFDTEPEYGPALAPKFLLVPFPRYRRDIWAGPPNASTQQWVEIAKNLLREDFQLEDPAINLLSQALGRMQTSGTDLSIPTLLAELQRPAYRSQSQKTLLNRLNGLLDSTGAVFAAGPSSGLDLRRLEGKSVIFSLESTGLSVRSLFYHDLYAWFSKYRESSASAGSGLRTVWLFDEAHTLFSRMLTNRNAMAEPLSLQMFRLARKRGIGLIVGDQIPQMENPVVRGNLGLKIIFRLPDHSAVHLYSRALGLSPEQQNALMNLPERTALVHHPRIPRPFLVRMPQIHFSELNELALQEHIERSVHALGIDAASSGWRSEPIVSGSQQQEKQNEKTNDSADLSLDALNYLSQISANPFHAAVDRDKELGLSNWKGHAVRKDLLRRDLILEVEISLGRRGRPAKFFEITEQGRGLLEQVGAWVPQKGRGGFKHRLYQHLLAERLEGEVEAVLSGGRKNVDVGAKIDGRWVCFEIVCSDVEKEVGNLEKDLSDGWSKVVFCADSIELRDALRARLGACDERVEIRLVRELIGIPNREE